MRYEEFPAIPALRAHVECLWAISSDGERAPEPSGTILPDGAVELVLNFGDPVRRDAPGGRRPDLVHHMIVGQLERASRVRYTGRVELLAVRFRPAGAHVFLPTPQDRIANRVAAVAEIAPGLARDLDRLVASRTSPERRVLALQRIVLAHRGRGLPEDAVVTRAVHALERSRGSIAISDLAFDLGLSTRQLERRFLRAVGLTPKRLARILRFRRVWQLAGRGTRRNWAEVAAGLGYADQAHMIKEVRKIAGSTPRTLLPSA